MTVAERPEVITALYPREVTPKEAAGIKSIETSLASIPLYFRRMSFHLRQGLDMSGNLPATEIPIAVCIQYTNETQSVEVSRRESGRTLSGEGYTAKLRDSTVSLALIESLRGGENHIVGIDDPLHPLVKTLHDNNYIVLTNEGWICHPQREEVLVNGG